MYYRFDGTPISQGGNGFSETPVIKNLYDPTTCIVGNLNADGSINSKNGNCATTGFIPVVAGKVFSAGYIKNGGIVRNPLIDLLAWREYCMTYQFYDSAKAKISSGSIARIENTANGIIVPAGSAFVRVSWNTYGGSDYFYPNQTPEMCYVTCADSAPTKPLPYEYNDGYTQELDSNAFFGKTLCVFGDSYSDSWGGHSWDAREITAANQGGTAENNTPWHGKLFWSKVCSELGLTLDNRAKGGSNLCKGSSSYESYNGIDRLDALVLEVKSGAKAPDYIVIQYGTNAWESQITTAADTSLSSYSGGLKYFIDTIHAELPETKICVMLPLLVADYPHRFNAHDIMLETLQLDGYKVPYVDMAAISGIVKADLPDGLHPASLKANTAYARGARIALMMAE